MYQNKRQPFQNNYEVIKYVSENKRQPFQNNYEVIKPQSSALFSSQGNFITS